MQALGYSPCWPPCGRMSLTNYIAQSMLGSFIYYGYGLAVYKHLGMAQSLLVGIAIFTMQLLWGRRWLARHKQGPLERLWYRLTWIGTPPVRTPKSVA